MNGVLRGNTYGPAYRSRPGWRRNDYWVRVDSAIGFRLNGVVRSSDIIYSSTKTVRMRCAYRTYLINTWSSTAVNVGFRLGCEWC